MLRLGAHESIAGGLHTAFARGQSVGCDALQIWVKNSRQWTATPLTGEEIRLFQEAQAATGIQPVVAHAAYIINPAAPDETLRRKSLAALILELERCEALGIPYLVLHPGSHTGAGEAEGLRLVAQSLGEAHAATPGYRVQILLEATAGQGTNLGYRFEQLAYLLEQTPQGDRLGICLDTCHLFGAGYELRTPEGYAATIAAFEQTIGLSRLKAWHLNDSKNGLGSRKDRHEHIGQGALRLEAFRLLLHDPRMEGLPGLLETDKSDDLHEDRENLATLRALCSER